MFCGVTWTCGQIVGRDLFQNTVTSHPSGAVSPTGMQEAARMPAGGGRVKVLFGLSWF